jgi:hypothetical protein
MTTRLKIDISQGLLEVEGSETFVKAIYNDFKAHFVEPNGQEDEAESPLTTRPKRVKTTRRSKTRTETVPLPVMAPPPAETSPPVPIEAEAAVPVPPEPVSPPPPPEPAPEPKAPPPSLPTYTFMQDLKLGHAGDRPSLVEFMDAKLPITNEERNLVFLYYLQHILKVKPITLDHVYTCYREAKIRAPLNIENSLRMTAEHRGWIKANQHGSMTVTSDGKMYVEKQLPKKVKN